MVINKGNKLPRGIFITLVRIRRGEAGQIAAFLLIMIVILLIAAVSLINIGKVSLHRLHTANAADAGALAGASVIAALAKSAARANLEYFIPTYFALKAAIQNNPNPFGQANWKDCKRLPVLCTSVPCPTQLLDFYLYLVRIQALILRYINLQIMLWDGFKTAKAEAHKAVFANVGIEEAQIRRRADKEILQPRLSKWLNGLAVTDPDLPSPGNFRENNYTFKWYSYGVDIQTGKEAREPAESILNEPNAVSSQVYINDCGLVLVPLPPQTIWGKYKFEFTGKRPDPDKTPWSCFPCTCKMWCCQPWPPCVSCCPCIPCNCDPDEDCWYTDRSAFRDWLKSLIPQQNTIAKVTYILSQLVPFIGSMTCFRTQTWCALAERLRCYVIQPLIQGKLNAIWVQEKQEPKKKCADLLSWTAVNLCGCGKRPYLPAVGKGEATIGYLVPIPYFIGIANIENPWLSVPPCFGCNIPIIESFGYGGEHIEFTVKVTYTETRKNMGFWQRRSTTVRSSATATVKCSLPGEMGCFFVSSAPWSENRFVAELLRAD